MVYSQFFILSSRGDVIISRDCTWLAFLFCPAAASAGAARMCGGRQRNVPWPLQRAQASPASRFFFLLHAHRFGPTDRGDLPKATAELFFRSVKKDKAGGRPFFVRASLGGGSSSPLTLRTRSSMACRTFTTATAGSTLC